MIEANPVHWSVFGASRERSRVSLISLSLGKPRERDASGFAIRKDTGMIVHHTPVAERFGTPVWRVLRCRYAGPGIDISFLRGGTFSTLAADNLLVEVHMPFDHSALRKKSQRALARLESNFTGQRWGIQDALEA